MKFHRREIAKGTYGELSKVREEVEEAMDAEEQGQPLMLALELSDILGAVRAVAERHGWKFEDLDRFAVLRSNVIRREIEERGARSDKPTD